VNTATTTVSEAAALSAQQALNGNHAVHPVDNLGGPAPARGRRREPKPKEDRHFVTALSRGLEVLACFRPGDRSLGNLEIAARCGLPKSTVSRLTATLTKLGYLIQVEENGRYRLGVATLSLGSAMLARLDVRQTARPLMQQLASATRSTLSLGTRDRLAMIYIENCRSSAPVMLSLDVGSRVPLNRSAIGRAWLGAANTAELAALLAEVETQQPQSLSMLREDIQRAQEDRQRLGVGCSFGDWFSDVNGIACAFRPGGSLPLMAINCGGRASTLSRAYLLDEVRPRLIELVSRLETSAAG